MELPDFSSEVIGIYIQSISLTENFSEEVLISRLSSSHPSSPSSVPHKASPSILQHPLRGRDILYLQVGVEPVPRNLPHLFNMM
jgi:hypothetical protein